MIIEFQKSQIKHNTGKAMLIELPHSARKVWIPNSLISIHLWYYQAYLPKHMQFSITYGKKYQKISANTLKEMFTSITPTITVKEHIPKMIKPKKVKVDDSLKR